MKELIEYLASSLATKPEHIKVTESVGERETNLELHSAPEDLNHLIGRHGRTIWALRVLLAAACSKCGRRYNLELAQQQASDDDGVDQ